MPVRNRKHWEVYPSSTLQKDLERFEIKNKLFRGEDLRISLVGSGIHNKSEASIVKKILSERK